VIRIVISDEAQADALNAFSFYEERRRGLGERFAITSITPLEASNAARNDTRKSIATFAEGSLNAFPTPSFTESTLEWC